ncbi:MAG: hypothetical protein IT480_02390 [Gammaproteobacteria bacterium]|nr:hypothetical protein [Gammaproteobacteria bacterium]
MTDERADLIDRLRALDCSRTPYAGHGAVGQTLGNESWRIVATGSQLAALDEAAAMIERDGEKIADMTRWQEDAVRNCAKKQCGRRDARTVELEAENAQLTEQLHRREADLLAQITTNIKVGAMLERDGARIAELEAELDEARAALDDVSAALGTNEFMDPPDGGSPSLAEQVRRMRAALAEAQRDAERYRLMRRNPTVDGESLVVVEVLDFNEDGPTDVYYAYAGDPLDAAIDAVIAKEQSHASE